MKFRVLCGTAILAATITGLATAAGITLTSGPTIPDCGGQAVAPASMTLTCADANYGLAGITWRDWGAKRATGVGSARVNNCTPNCAAGKFQGYPVTAAASGIATCRSGRKQYTRLVLTYPGPRPTGIGATDTWKFPCDAPGPGSTITAKTVAKNQLKITGTGWQKGARCKPTVAVGFADKATPFVSAEVGANYGFALTLVDIRAGAVVVARQTCTTALGARLYESAIVVR